MIFITQQPTSDSVFLDSQLIHFSLYTEADHTRIKAQFTKSGSLDYEEYNWPKFSAKELQHSLTGFIKNKLITTTAINPAVSRINNLFKTNIFLFEHTGIIGISGKTLNPFFIMYSNNNLETLPHSDLEFLGIAESLIINANGTLTVPFFSNINQTLSISLIDQDNNNIYSGSLNASKAYYLFKQKLALNYNVESLSMTIQSANRVITKKIRVLKNTSYSNINIRFVNQFGALIYTQFFASLEEKNDFENTVYQDQNSRLYNAEINTKATLTVNTGYLFSDEKFIIEQILNSTKVEIEYKGKYIPIVSSTKSFKPFLSKEFLNTSTLTFIFDKYAVN